MSYILLLRETDRIQSSLHNALVMLPEELILKIFNFYSNNNYYLPNLLAYECAYIELFGESCSSIYSDSNIADRIKSGKCDFQTFLISIKNHSEIRDKTFLFKEYFDLIDLNHKGFISYEDFNSLIISLNINISPNLINEFYQELLSNMTLTSRENNFIMEFGQFYEIFKTHIEISSS